MLKDALIYSLMAAFSYSSIRKLNILGEKSSKIDTSVLNRIMNSGQENDWVSTQNIGTYRLPAKAGLEI